MRLPSITEHSAPSDHLFDAAGLAERVRVDLSVLDRDSAVRTALSDVPAPGVPSPALSAISSGAASAPDNARSEGTPVHTHFVGTRPQYSSHSHSPSLQATYPPYSGITRTSSPARPSGVFNAVSAQQARSVNEGAAADSGQPFRPRQTPAANFAALFPPPRVVTSVTTVHSAHPSHASHVYPYQQSDSLPTPAPSSRSSSNSSHRCQPYSHSYDSLESAAHFPSLSPTTSSIGSPAPPSLSNAVLGAGLSQTNPRRSSSCAISAVDFDSPSAHSALSASNSVSPPSDPPNLHSSGLQSTNSSNYQSSDSAENNASVGPPSAQGFEPNLPSLPTTGLPSWPGVHSTPYSNQAKPYRLPSTGSPGLHSYSNYSHTRPATSTSSLWSHSQHTRAQSLASEQHISRIYNQSRARGTQPIDDNGLRNSFREQYSQTSYSRDSPYSSAPYSTFPITADSGASAYETDYSFFPRVASGQGAGPVSGGLLTPFATNRRGTGHLSNQQTESRHGHYLSGTYNSSSLSTSISPNTTVSALTMDTMDHGDVDLESYDDEDDILTGLPQASPSTHTTSEDYSAMGPGANLGSGSKKDEKQVRRRSSKACDQCRKSKCKCERTGDGEPCKSCILLGAQCTFLGPSRKRGPPKGYIDAIESRLHQTEALVGILLALANPGRTLLDGGEPRPDERARSLLDDLRNFDPLAREIVERVDRGAYGTLGRKSNPSHVTPKNPAGTGSGTSGDEKSGGSGGTSKNVEKNLSNGKAAGMGDPPPSIQGRGRMVELGQEMEMGGLSSAHPSNEWQDTVTERIKAAVRSRAPLTPQVRTSPGVQSGSSAYPSAFASANGGQHFPIHEMDGSGERNRQRRRINSMTSAQHTSSHSPERAVLGHSTHRQSISSVNGASELTTASVRYSPPVAPMPSYVSTPALNTSLNHSSSAPSTSHMAYGHGMLENQDDIREGENVEDEEGITDGVGQLSINEEAQVRFHGKASGLHLLGHKLRVDGRNKGGVWHFPKARVWPPVAPTSAAHIASAEEAEACERAARARLPTRDVQEQLLELYFSHVHIFLPVVHKETFWSDFRRMHDEQERYRGSVEAAEANASRGRSTGAPLHKHAQTARSTSTGYTSTVDGEPSDNTPTLPAPRIPTLLLLAMFSIAARYSPVALGTSSGSASSPYQFTTEPSILSATSSSVQGIDSIDFGNSMNPEHLGGSESDLASVNTANSATKGDPEIVSDIDSDAALPLPQSGHMWAAGDGFLERAKGLLDRTYASSRPSTCQALLLMGYREIGIGAMAQSWLYVGMAVRMAQDLGMHRSSDGWSYGDGPIFSPVEQQVRKRIWYACVIMDKYVSTYIGRPLSIFESDYDTQLPGIEESEERDLWEPGDSMPNSMLTDPIEIATAPVAPFTPAPGKVLSCFNESARLSSILAMIIQAIYAVKPVPSRHLEALQLERILDRWYMELPEHLCYNTSVKNVPSPPPNVLTLHMQYWCAVLLLHRPFIRHYIAMRRRRTSNPDSPIDPDAYSAAQKSFDLCVSAANHITSIVSVYQEHFCLKRCSVFLSYYIFSAGIMHMTTMATNINDPQASLGLSKCMDVLKRIEIVWPSAGRAWELLHGAKDDLPAYEQTFFPIDRSRKRSADDPLDTSSLGDSSYLNVHRAGSIPTQTYTTPATNGHRYTPAIDLGDSDPPLALFSAYSRWSSDGSMGFPSGLSTSVLPRQYSTGFVDDRAMRRSPSGMMDNSGRYPQYWSDYSMGQPSSVLGSMYGMSMLSHQSHHEHPAQHHSQGSHHNIQGQSSPVYMNEQYNVFSE
ncbi:hypothetical protein M0805_000178 [Coniferiporia weirii]|nr:hypothetical protein M0805_000178 [Coniferiporia weirii]